MNATFQRAIVHYEQGRIDEAENEFRVLLTEDPENGLYHAYLALIFNHKERYAEAYEEIGIAIGYNPDIAFCFYIRALIEFSMDKVKESEQTILQAIYMEPEDEDFYALLSSILQRLKRWDEALVAANKGLEIDPDSISCNNLRSSSLVNMGRKEEAGISLNATLMKDPENASTHANKGWALLHEGKIKEALHHFRESLRIDPGNEYARLGIIEGLKARNILYRPLLTYFLWMSRLSSKAQWGVIIGLYVGMRVLRIAGNLSPEVRPLAMIGIALYMLFVYFSWTAVPLFNLLLKLDSYGKHALSDKEKRESNWVGTFFFTGIISLILSFVLKMPILLHLGIISLVMVVPLAGTFNLAPGLGRKIMSAYTLLVGTVGISSVVFAGLNNPITGNLILAFIVGVVGFQFLANFLAIRNI